MSYPRLIRPPLIYRRASRAPRTLTRELIDELPQLAAKLSAIIAAHDAGEAAARREVTEARRAARNARARAARAEARARTLGDRPI